MQAVNWRTETGTSLCVLSCSLSAREPGFPPEEPCWCGSEWAHNLRTAVH